MEKLARGIWILIYWVLEKIVKPIMKKISPIIVEKYWEVFIQFLKFGLVGLSNTIVSYVVYCVLIIFNMHYQIANALGFIVSILNAFYWNSKYVFKQEDNKKSKVHSLIKTFVSYSGTFLITVLLLSIWIKVLDVSAFIAPVLNMIITIPINFLLNKFWTFKE